MITTGRGLGGDAGTVKLQLQLVGEVSGAVSRVHATAPALFGFTVTLCTRRTEWTLMGMATVAAPVTAWNPAGTSILMFPVNAETCPPSQMFAPAEVPQAPQFAGSRCVSTHSFPHCATGQARHAAPWHTSVPPQ